MHKEAGDKVFLLCVVEEVHPHLPATDYYNTMRKQINEQLHEKAAAVLKRFSVMLANENVRAAPHLDTSPRRRACHYRMLPPCASACSLSQHAWSRATD